MYHDACIKIHDSLVCMNRESCSDCSGCSDCALNYTCIMIHDSSICEESVVWSGYNGGRGYFSFSKCRGYNDYAAALSTLIYPVLIFDSFQAG